jgi:hypothetical protein
MEEKKKVVKKSPKKTTKNVSTKKETVKKVVTKKEVEKIPEKKIVKEEAKTVYTEVGPRRKQINNIGLLAQAVLTTYAILLLVGSLFNDFFLNIFDAVVSMLLLVTAYNNNKVFQRKNLTFIYTAAGILFAGMFVYNLFK